jgi:hypothetical protein
LGLKINKAFTVHPTDKSKSTVVPDTANYSQNIAALMKNHAYRKLKWTLLNLWSARP